MIPDWTVETCLTRMSDPAFDLLWMELDQQAATVLIHPAAPVATYDVTPTPVTDCPLETARIASDLLRRGVTKRFPQIRFVLRMQSVGPRRSPSNLPSHAVCSRTILAQEVELQAAAHRFSCDLALALHPNIIAWTRPSLQATIWCSEVTCLSRHRTW